jgi:hypothetical protein
VEGLDVTGNVFGAWTSILVAAMTFAALAVGVPIAVIKTLSLVETAGSWTLDRVHRLMRRRSAAAGPEPSDLVRLPGADHARP